MTDERSGFSRRRFLRTLGLAPFVWGYANRLDAAAQSPITRPIPASGERLPVIGMGSWITFNVGDDVTAREQRVRVLQHFFARGGAVIDSSPMYGSSEEVIGHCLRRIGGETPRFSATKVWTWGRAFGQQQMARSEQLWATKGFDLMQIHNLLDWETHLPTLRERKAQGRIRYIGLTTSHGSRHTDLERIMRTEPIDFVQFTYNVVDREAERRLLPLAAERGIAVIVNRPFQGGALFDRVAGQALPEWAGEIGCANWAQFLLKFIVSHPAVTCAIPATSRVDHMQENMGALYGRLPDTALRQRMVRWVEAL
ncbi:MAG: aldo/keto reductase [Proteobacteria bacterium]|nr:MAG: aldo/keto reductase [Pseudomonadota bacterium]QKK10726.1 MAG: aldo/keto reductase [Pseudomonadota bacterium]